MLSSVFKFNGLKKIYLIYLVGFFFSLHVALPAYINSTFLSSYTTEKLVGLVFTVSSLLTIFSFILIPRVLKRFGNYRTVCVLGIVEIISLLVLASSKNIFLIIISFVINFIVISIISFNIDIFLEESSPREFVGKIRGFFLTIINSAWVLATALTGLILATQAFEMIYLASALLIIPVVILLAIYFKNFRDPHYKKTPIISTLVSIWKNKNVLKVFMISFLLQFFFVWMVIYTPLYLHEYVGFEWSAIGVMFAIMLIPFPILEWPLGKLADKYFGEKEILSIGFMVMAVSTTLIAFVTVKDFLLWVSLLTATRIGAAMVEVGSEIYFFKKVPDTSLGTISLFRSMRPFAYLFGPIVATIVLTFFDLSFLFVFLGLLMLYGLRFTHAMKDTL